MSSKTVSSLNKIYEALNSVVIPRGEKTKEEYVTILSNNISKFEELKTEYESLLNDNIKKAMYYYEKFKVAKKEHSREYYNKKVKKYNENAIAILQRLNINHQSIERLNELKNNISKGENTEVKNTENIENKLFQFVDELPFIKENE